MNLHKYDTLNQEIQVTPDYGYITNGEISQCHATITKQVWDPVTEPPNTTLKVECTYPLDGRQVHAHTKQTGHRDHHRYKG